MSNTSIIMGESGTGKSTSIRTLNPKETFIINVLNKPLPFRGYRAQYKELSSDGLSGNYYSSMSYDAIHRVLQLVNTKRLEIKTIILDDFQYLMANEFMSKALETGYQKFSSIGKNAYDLLKSLPSLRSDLDIFVLSHSEANESGKMKLKTVGKMLEDKVVMEGMNAMVLQTELVDGNYCFITQGDARNIAKSPMGMFEEKRIPNDLQLVKTKMREYYDADEEDVKAAEEAEKKELIEAILHAPNIDELRALYKKSAMNHQAYFEELTQAINTRRTELMQEENAKPPVKIKKEVAHVNRI